MRARVMVTMVTHDLRVMARERAVWIALGVLGVALAVALANGLSWTRQQVEMAEVRTAAQASWSADVLTRLETWERTRDGEPPPHWHPSTAGGSATNAFLPPAPLSVLGIGQADLYPMSVRVAMWMRRADQFSGQELRSPLQLLTGRLDVLFVVVFLYPLVIIGLTYRLLAADRESGVLALVLTHPVSLRSVLWTKVASAAIVAAALPLLLVTAAVAIPELRAHPSRVIAWSLVVGLYGTFWILLAAIVNLWSSRASTNAIVLTGAWLLLVLIVPSIVSVAVEVRHPLPSRLDMLNAARAANLDALTRADALLTNHYRDHPDQAHTPPDVERQNKLWVVQHREVDRQTVAMLEAWEAAVAGQHAAAQRWAVWSPAVLTHEALTAIGGMGHDRWREFTTQVRTFQDHWAARYGGMVFRGDRVSAADWRSRAVFRFEETRLDDILTARWNLLMWLVLAIVAPAALAWRLARPGRPV